MKLVYYIIKNSNIIYIFFIIIYIYYGLNKTLKRDKYIRIEYKFILILLFFYYNKFICFNNIFIILFIY